MKEIPVALQMYTLRNEAEKDYIGTLQKVADLGYEGVELAGYGGLSVKELKGLLDKLNLRAVSSHISLSELRTNADQVIEDQLELGSTYIVCPYLPPEERTEEDYFRLIDDLNTIGAKCFEAGITLCYHHHDFELMTLSNGKTALETILAETNPHMVKAEFDIYWLTYAGEKPVEWLKRYQGRTPLVHLKDMTTDGERFFAELGSGGVDLEPILEFGMHSDVDWWIVEQDDSKIPPIDSVRKSLEYLRHNQV
ncbi:sugar phosphate isomerase/epimerase [Rossellomorea vietnamensis]|uniref:Sugar phosphate isomerase/epimerase n=1 Tax=Rossellomorea vietnamensis TaxID=218284 RepID=A0ACD4C5P4_9BACI|nr:sugar phosphate isomerase/epimerase [Rossellomorea vietnamensis]UXH43579.1 sugar phosphate isomerase/epimerase [Rossellomorea vietnamensis]WQI94929.1 sugar phosphate isomerase/epimerase [Rossellomorea vietnamensis]